MIVVCLIFSLMINVLSCTVSHKEQGVTDDVTTPPASDAVGKNEDTQANSEEDIPDSEIPKEEIPEEDAPKELPAVYRTVVEEFIELIRLRLSLTGGEDDPDYTIPLPNPELAYEWGCMFVELVLNVDSPTVSSFGYVLKDINGDGTDELFIVRNDNFIFALYTMRGDEANLVGAYWPRHSCYILNSDELLVRSSGGLSDNVCNVQTVDTNTGELITNRSFGSESLMDDNGGIKINYYETVYEEKISMSRERISHLMAVYSDMIVNELEITYFE